MSFTSLKIEECPLLSKAANDSITKSFVWAIPSDTFLSALPVPLANLEIAPFVQDLNQFRMFESILDMDIRSDDVFVCSLPKCGSSWLQNITWLLKNDLDYKSIGAKREKLTGDFEHFPRYAAATNELLANDRTKLLSYDDAFKNAFFEFHNDLKSPRVIKAHMPVYGLPKKIWSQGAKIIYICRNLKDMIVSEYHLWRNYFLVDVTMDDVVNGITNDTFLYSSHMKHVLNYWHLRHLPNVLFITYEDLLSDSFGTIKKMSKFLECCYTDEQLKELTEFTSFQNMKKNPNLSREEDVFLMEKFLGKKRPDPTFRFLRKGKIGSYRDELNEDQIKKIDVYTEKWIKNTDCRFKEWWNS